MSQNPITIRNLGPEEAHLLDRVRSGLFASDVDPSRAWAFLATRVNKLVVALDRGEVVGFAAGPTMMHPSRPTQFLISEISMHEDFEGSGVEKRLLERISELARDRGCEVIWILTEADDTAWPAPGTQGARRTDGLVRIEWD